MRVLACLSLVLVTAAAAVAAAAEEHVTVQTDKGPLRGARKDGEGEERGRHYYAFTGIRYAQTPTGKLRFKASGFFWGGGEGGDEGRGVNTQISTSIKIRYKSLPKSQKFSK